ncbi:unnamed protein product [Closterium sp. Naga37s-1]|nr:unnamed protein product [Closterium sp. Naga37s-1]
MPPTLLDAAHASRRRPRFLTALTLPPVALIHSPPSLPRVALPSASRSPFRMSLSVPPVALPSSRRPPSRSSPRKPRLSISPSPSLFRGRLSPRHLPPSLPSSSLIPRIPCPASPHPLPCFPVSPSLLPPILSLFPYIPCPASPHPLPYFPPSPSLLSPIPFPAPPHSLRSFPISLALPPSPFLLPPLLDPPSPPPLPCFPPSASLLPHVHFPASSHLLRSFPVSPSLLPLIPFPVSPHPLPCSPPSPAFLPLIPFPASPHSFPCFPSSRSLLPPIPFPTSPHPVPFFPSSRSLLPPIISLSTCPSSPWDVVPPLPVAGSSPCRSYVPCSTPSLVVKTPVASEGAARRPTVLVSFCRQLSFLPTLSHSFPHSLVPSHPLSFLSSLSHSFPPSLIHFLTLSFPPTLSHSFPHSLIPSHPLSFLSSLSHSLPPSLIPFLILSFPPTLSHSFPHSLIPSHPLSFLSSLSHSLPPSLIPFLTLSFLPTIRVQVCRKVHVVRSMLALGYDVVITSNAVLLLRKAAKPRELPTRAPSSSTAISTRCAATRACGSSSPTGSDGTRRRASLSRTLAPPCRNAIASCACRLLPTPSLPPHPLHVFFYMRPILIALPLTVLSLSPFPPICPPSSARRPTKAP